MSTIRRVRNIPANTPIWMPSEEQQAHIKTVYQDTGKVKIIPRINDEGTVLTTDIEFKDNATKAEYLADPVIQATIAARDAYYAQFNQ